MREELVQSIDECVAAIEQLHTPKNILFIEQVVETLSSCFIHGNKVLIAGNGGSMCDAMHFAEELTGVFREKRRPLPAIALSDIGHISCTANDLGYEYIFSRAIEAYGKEGDLFIGLTTSGNSPNIIRAIEAAKGLGLQTVLLLGKGGGKLKNIADFELIIEGFSSSDRIQEAHMAALHLIIEFCEKKIFTKNNFNDKILLCPPSVLASK